MMDAHLEDSSEYYPFDLQHIVPLDFRSILKVPESHSWTQNDLENGFSSSGLSSDDLASVPIIDFDDPNAPIIIAQALESWGVFQLTNHGIPMKLIEDVLSETERLFSLSMEHKMKALRSPTDVTGYGVAPISSFFLKHMWHEGFTIMGSPMNHAKALWPHDFERFCEIMDNCQKEMKVLCEKLMRIILLKILKISEQEVKSWLSVNTTSTCSTTTKNCRTAIQLNSYPPCPDPNKALGLGPHTDTSLVTLLQQTQTSGLQVFKERVGWVPVRPISGALVVHIGDFLHILSNARFRSVLHRVVVNKSRQRFSFAYFYSPPADFSVSPLLSKDCFDSSPKSVPLYRSVTVKEYVAIKAKNLEKALSLVKNFN